MLGFKKLFSDERGSASYLIVFAIIVVVVGFVGAVMIPFLQTFAIEMYGASDNLIEDAKASVLANVEDENAQGEIIAALETQQDSLQGQIELYSEVAKYIALIVIFLTFLVLFMFSRRDVETSKFA